MSGKIKVYIPSLDKKPSTGKGFFFQRLAEHLKKIDVDVFSDSKSMVDIALHNVRVRSNNAKYNIVRIDGVYHNKKQDWKKLNKTVFKGFRSLPDGIIYQSNFSKSMADRYLGEFVGLTTIISNGADPNFYLESIPLSLNFKYNFITSSRWRPHKRLRNIIESFLLAGIENSGLYVAGDLKASGLTKEERKRYFSMSSIIGLGSIDQASLARYLVSSSAFIHLCWFDNCPNGVVEALCAGVPVITNNVGGTREIVAPGNGIISHIDKPYDLKPCDLYNPPDIDINLISNAMRYILDNREIKNDHVDIKNIAVKYKQFFEEIIKNGK